MYAVAGTLTRYALFFVGTDLQQSQNFSGALLFVQARIARWSIARWSVARWNVARWSVARWSVARCVVRIR